MKQDGFGDQKTGWAEKGASSMLEKIRKDWTKNLFRGISIVR
jgi:hypothetical protein